MTDHLPSTGLLGAYHVPDDMRTAAVAAVARRVTDPADRAVLLDILGLGDVPELSTVSTAPDKPISTGQPPASLEPSTVPAPVRTRTAALRKPAARVIHARSPEPAREPPHADRAPREPWMVHEQTPQPPAPHANQRRPTLLAEVMAAPMTWDEWMTQRANTRAGAS